MKCIVAVDENWGIGKDGELLFRISEDLKRFRSFTEHNAVIMGRKTLLSLPGGKPLKNRRSIVLSRNADYRVEHADVCASVEELLSLLKTPDYRDVEAYVIGGAEIYRLLLPYCSEAIVTHIRAMAAADCFFPDLKEEPGWEVIKEEPPNRDGDLSYQYVTYTNVSGRP
ncbi:dihydrofolate reductase [Christensenellaceae bacterium OttesenSCG-928-M15]|nr:dihydrofolate reductase [Christensenellaceae bacterium OttesenSCG-928-M15]